MGVVNERFQIAENSEDDGRAKLESVIYGDEIHLVCVVLHVCIAALLDQGAV